MSPTRPIEGATELRDRIFATDSVIPVISTNPFQLDARKKIGDEFVVCSGFGVDAFGWPVMTGCQRGVSPEEGGVEGRFWPAGTPVVEVGWTTIEIVTTIPVPTLAMVGRQFLYQDPATGNTYTFNVVTNPDGDPVIDWINEPPVAEEAFAIALTAGFPTTATPAGIHVDPSGKVLSCEPGSSSLRRYNTDGSLDVAMTSTYGRGWDLATSYAPSVGSATNQLQTYPGVGAIDASNRLYVEDSGNNRILLLDGTSWGFIQALSGYSLLEATCLDPSGNLYVSFGGAVRKQGIFPTFTLAWNVVINAAQNFKGVACDGTSVFLVGTTANVVYKRIASSGAAGSPATMGTAGTGNGQLSFPQGIAVDANNIYVADDNRRIAVFNKATGAWVRNIGPSAAGYTGEGSLDGLRDVEVDPTTGNLLILSNSRQAIMEYTTTGQFVRESLPSAVTSASVSRIAVDPFSQRLYMARDTPRIDRLKGSFKPTDVVVTGAGEIVATDNANDCVHRFSSAGAFLSGAGGFGTGTLQFNQPAGIDVRTNGDLVIADKGNGRVQVLSSALAYVSTPITGLSNPSGLAVDPSDTVYIADLVADPPIRKYTSSYAPVGAFGTVGNANGQVNQPAAIDVDSLGRMWIADTGNHRVHLLAADGSFLAKAGSRGAGATNLNAPSGIALVSDTVARIADPGNLRTSLTTLVDPSEGAVQAYSGGAFVAAVDILDFASPFLITAAPAGHGNIDVAPGTWVPITPDLPFTAVPTFSVNTCFSAKYADYLIEVDFAQSVASNMNVQLRAAGVTLTTTTYYTGVFLFSTVLTSVQAGNVLAANWLARSASGAIVQDGSLNIRVNSPFLADQTTAWTEEWSYYGTGVFSHYGNHAHSGAQSFDGFTLFVSSGTMTGSLRVSGRKV